MEVPNSKTPESYDSIATILSYGEEQDTFEGTIDVNVCTIEDYKPFFHVSFCPDVSDISSVDDIETLHSFIVGEDEEIGDVKIQAQQAAWDEFKDRK